MRQAQLAINSISTRHRNLEEALAAYTSAGFQNVEFALPDVKDWLAQGHTLAQVQDLLTKHGLRSIGGFETHVACFASEDEQRANLDLHLANIQLLHSLGGGTLVVGTDGPAQRAPDALDTIARRIRLLANESEGTDVQIAIEFNWSPLIKSLKSAVAVAARIAHPRVGVLFDPAHYYTTPTKFADLSNEMVRWLKHVHVNDMRDKPADLSDCNADRVLPGEGILNVHALLEALEHNGYHGFFSIEMFSDELWSLPASQAARRCYQSLLPLCQSEGKERS